ncbi:MAG TPA: hypothetical protein VH274_03845 [Mycobacteriales bacterium]|nr:hypothetical protein [Mycobacteriales bacterium]
MRKTIRRATIALALTPVLGMPAGLAATALASASGNGGTTVSTPAPPGDASAVAAEVDGVVSVGKTKAHAGSGGGSADADALTVLGNQISGGSQQGTGSKTGNLIGTGDTPIGDAEVAPWSAKVANAGGGYQSHAEAALAHAKVADLVELWLLHSQSDATWTPDASTGDAQSDGAEVSALGMLDIKVLHSEAHSTGKGHSDLLVVNDNEIGSSDQANGACKLDLSPVLNLLCLTASGGTGKNGVTSAASDVATFDVGGGSLTGTISGSASSGGAAGTPELPAPSQAANRGGGRSSGARAPAATPAQASLPFTGADAERSAVVALALAMIGVTATMFGRRRRLVVS